MIKSAIEKIVSLVKPEIVNLDGENYALSANGGVVQVRPELDITPVLELNSLDSLVKMIRTELVPMVGANSPVYVSVVRHDLVDCFLQPSDHVRRKRVFPYTVRATDIPGWGEQVQMNFEEAMIALRTRFQETPDSEYALKLLSDITTGSKVTYNDNGIATSVVTQSGVALQSNQKIRPIIKLRPYRTFQEVEQPESLFLIRVNERGIKFVEADGGMWKLSARESVKAWLESSLEDLVLDGSVVISL